MSDEKPQSVESLVAREANRLSGLIRDPDSSVDEIKTTVDRYESLVKAKSITGVRAAKRRRFRFAVVFLLIAMILTIVIWYTPYSVVRNNPILGTVATSRLQLTSAVDTLYADRVDAKGIRLSGSYSIVDDETGDKTNSLEFDKPSSPGAIYDLSIPAGSTLTIERKNDEVRLGLFSKVSHGALTIEYQLFGESITVPGSSELATGYVEFAGGTYSVALAEPDFQSPVEFNSVTNLSFESQQSRPGHAQALSEIRSGNVTFPSVGKTVTLGPHQFLRLLTNVNLDYVSITHKDGLFQTSFTGQVGAVAVSHGSASYRIDPTVLDVASQHAGLALIWSTLFFLYGSLWSIHEILRGIP